jgi:hypothetical protein
VKIWQHAGGKSLMKAIGFGEPIESLTKEGQGRSIISLRHVSNATPLPSDLVKLLQSRRFEISQEILAMDGAPSIAAVVRDMKQHHAISEVRDAVDTALTLVKNILHQPRDFRVYRVKRGNPSFHRNVGRLDGSDMLMRAIGFISGPSDDLNSNSSSASLQSTLFLKESNAAIYYFKTLTQDDSKINNSASGLSSAKFQFPGLDANSEKFLLRRTADLEVALRELDLELSKRHPETLNDAAHVLGVTKETLKASHSEKLKTYDGKKSSTTSAIKRPASAPRDMTKKHKESKLNVVNMLLANSNPAQKLQLAMIQEVFTLMDADKDGLLTAPDIKAYFRSIGRQSTDDVIRKWILHRDIDQDGAVSLKEFIASFSLQLDSTSAGYGKEKESTSTITESSVTSAFGALRLGNTLEEVLIACETVEEYIRRVLESPSVKAFWNISTEDKIYHQKIGRLFSGTKFIVAMGFVLEGNSTILALKNNQDRPWDTVPIDVRINLNKNLDEMLSHKAALMEPRISNLAAVSNAIKFISNDRNEMKAWLTAFETIHKIVSNIIDNPSNTKFYRLQSTNGNFHSRIGKLPGAVMILRSLGFRDEEGGVLELPLSIDMKELAARKLEIEVGTNLLKEKIDIDAARQRSKSVDKSATIQSKFTRKSSKDEGSFSPDKENIENEDKNKISSSKALIKRDAQVQEEKRLRKNAELALTRNQNLLAELEAQIYEYKEREINRATLRNAITNDRSHPNRQETMKPSPAIQSGLTNIDLSKKEQHTVLLEACPSGSTRLPIETSAQKLFQKGMLILIGSGATMEVKKVAGFGSIIIDKGLTCSQPKGAPIYAYSNIPKNVAKIERKIVSQYIDSLLTDDIMSSAVNIASQKLQSREANATYASRPIKVSITTAKFLQVHDHDQVIKFNTSNSDLITFGKNALILSANGKCSMVKLQYSAVDILEIYLRVYSFSKSEDAIDKDLLERYIRSDSSWSTRFLALIQYNQFGDLNEFLEFYSKHTRISWNSFICMMQPWRQASRYQTSASSITSINSSTILQKLFQLLDCDYDELISVLDVFEAFNHMDGCPPHIDDFNHLLAATIGFSDMESKLSTSQFILIRSEYSAKHNLCLCGRKLEGFYYILQAISDKFLSQGEIYSDRSLIRPESLIPFLGEDFLHKHVTVSSTIEEQVETYFSFLASINSSTTADRIISSLLSDSSVAGLSLIETPCGTSSYHIIQVLSNSRGNAYYALDSTGVVHVCESSSLKELFQQRVIWLEPVPARQVEGREKFRKWLMDMDLLTDDQHQKPQSEEILSSSRSMTQLMMRFPNDMSKSILSIDQATGLIAVNNSLTSKSISFHDPVSAQRLYRVKVDSYHVPEIDDIIEKTVSGRFLDYSNITPQLCSGIMESIKLLSKQSLMLCQLMNSNFIVVMNMFSGELMMKLTGHQSPLSCMTVDAESGLILTGCYDGMIRVWRDRITMKPYSLDSDSKPTESMINTIASAGTSASSNRGTMRNFALALCRFFRVHPVWRKAQIVGFYDGKADEYYSSYSHHADIVEVRFEDSTVRLITDKTLIRSIDEVDKSPFGPPLWNQAEAFLRLGSYVAIFDHDPEHVAILLARMLRKPYRRVLNMEESVQVIETLVCQLDHVIKVNSKEILEILALHSLSKLNIQNLIRKIFTSSEQYPSFSDRVLVGNRSRVSTISFCPVTKLLVSITEDGILSIWDPCLERTCLTSNPIDAEGLNMIGKYPYQLVNRIAITNIFPGKICGCSFLSASNEVAKSFPIMDKDMLIKAQAIDSNFIDASARGFIYVYQDMSFITIKSPGFSPYLVCLDATELFVDGHMQSSSAASSNSSDIWLQLYQRRESLLRVVYAVSNTHENVETLAVDLNQYGVIPRGYTSTPSENIEVACFERPAGWSSRYTTNSLIPKPVRQFSQGMIVGETTVNGIKMVEIALDYSNDIVLVQHSAIHRILSNHSRLELHCRVEVELMSLTSKPSSNSHTASLILVSVNSSCATTQQSAIIPVVLGRSTIIRQANQVDSSVPETMIEQLDELQLRNTLTLFLLAGVSHNIACSSQELWKNLHDISKLRIASMLSQQVLDDPKLLQSSAYSAFLDEDSIIHFSHQILQVYLTYRNLHPTHPVIRYVQETLGFEVSELTKSPRKSSNLRMLRLTENKWLLEDIYRSFLTCKTLLTGDIQNLLARRDVLLSSLDNIPSIPSLSAEQVHQLIHLRVFDERPVESHSSGGLNLAKVDHGIFDALKHLLSQELTSRALHLEERCFSHLSKHVKLSSGSLLRVCQQLIAVVKSSVSSTNHLKPTTFPMDDEDFESFAAGNFLIVKSNACANLSIGYLVSVVEVKAERRTIDPTQTIQSPHHHFLVMDCNNAALSLEERSLLSSALPSLNRLINILHGLPVVSSVSDVSLNPISSSKRMIFHYDPRWTSVQEYVKKNGGLLLSGNMNLFRILSNALVSTVNAIHERGILILGLTSHNIYINSSGTSIKILLPPTALARDEQSSSSHYLDYYLTSVKGSNLSIFLPSLDFNARQVDVSWDNWSVAVCIYMLAFGNILNFELCDLLRKSGSSSSAELCVSILRSIYKTSPGGSDVNLSLFDYASLYLHVDINHLKSFRDNFCKESLSVGLNVTDASYVWEQTVHIIFCSLMNEPGATLTGIENKLHEIPRHASSEMIRDWLSSTLRIELTKNTFDTMMVALVPSDFKAKPILERAVRAMKNLFKLLPDMINYGYFYELLYFLSTSMMTSSSHDCINLCDARRLLLFSGTDEASFLLAREDGKRLMMMFPSVDAFVDEVFILPTWTSSCEVLFDELERSGQSSSRASIERVSTVMAYFEELMSTWSDLSSNKAVVDCITQCNLLLQTKVDALWVIDNINSVIEKLVDHGWLEVLVLFVLRYEMEEIDKDNDRGMVSSKLLLRLIKFLQHAVQGISKSFIIDSEIDPEKYMSMMEHMLTAEKIYEHLLRAILMVYCCEEVPFTHLGQANDTLYGGHQRFFDHLEKLSKQDQSKVSDLTLSKQKRIASLSHWSLQTSKLAEPLLLACIGELGKGSRNMRISGIHLANIDNSIDKRLRCDFGSHSMMKFFSLRGSYYYVDIIRIMRQYTVLDMKRHEKRVVSGQINRNLDLFISSAISLIHVEQSSSSKLSTSEVIYPSNVSTQRIQLFLDLKLSSKVLNNIESASDSRTILLLLRFFLRGISFCSCLQEDYIACEPFASLAKELTSPSWMLIVSYGLRNISASKEHPDAPEIVALALQGLAHMTRKASWMRSWNHSDIFINLIRLGKIKSTAYAEIKNQAMGILKHAATKLADLMPSLQALQIPLTLSLASTILPSISDITSLYEEAKDISFGSTLQEQDAFIERLNHWMSFILQSSSSMEGTASAMTGNQLTCLYEIAKLISTWISKISLSLAIFSMNEKPKKGKLELSCNVAKKQIQCLGRLLGCILLSSSSSASAIDVLLTCLWSKSETGLPADDAIGGGLLAAMEQLTTRGAIIDIWSSLDLQHAIIAELVKVSNYSSIASFTHNRSQYLQTLSNSGVVRIILKYIISTISFIQDVHRLGYVPQFSKVYRAVIGSVMNSWSCMLSLQYSQIVHDIIDSGIIVKLVEKWLTSDVIINLIGISSLVGVKEVNPFLIKSIALLMIQLLIDRHTEDSSAIYYPLLQELLQSIALGNIITRNVDSLLQNDLTFPGSDRAIKGTSLKEEYRKLAAKTLTSLSSLKESRIEDQLKVSKLSSNLKFEF